MQFSTGQLFCVSNATVRTNSTANRSQNLIYLGRNNSSTGNYGYLKFESFAGLENVPSNATVVSATLHFRPTDNYSDSGFGYRYFACDGAWDAETITWANRPAGEDVVAAGSITGKSWHTIDITAIAQAWLTNPNYDYANGLFIRANTENRYSYKVIGGSENANYRPYIQITYDVPASMPTYDRESYKMGETATVTLDVAEEGTTHTVAFYVGEQLLHSVDLGVDEDVTSYTIPQTDEFGALFGDLTAIPLIVKATTMVGSEVRGTVESVATVTLPDDAVPTPTISYERTGQGVVPAFVQLRSGIRFATGGEAKYGATIISSAVTFENVTAEGEADYPTIYGSGDIAYTYTARDNRGMVGTLTGTITVLPWTAPQVSSFSVQRVLENGAPDLGGTYANATVKASVSMLEVDGTAQNELVYTVQYRVTGTEDDWSKTEVIVADGTELDVSYMLARNGVAVDDISDLQGFTFRLSVKDIFGTETLAYAELATKEIFLHIKRSAKSVGIGMETTGTSESPKVDVAQDVHIRGGLKVDGGIDGVGITYSTDEQLTGDTWIDGKPIYRRVLTASITGNGSKVIGNIGTNIETFLTMRGQFKSGSDNWRPFPNGYYGGINYMTGFLYEIQTGDVRVQFGTQLSGTSSFVIVFEYTKK